MSKASKLAICITVVILLVAGICVKLIVDEPKAPSAPSSTATNSEMTQPVNTPDVKELLPEGVAAEEDIIVIGNTTEHIKTISPVSARNADASLVGFYTPIEVPGYDYYLYAYTDADGKIKLRVYGSCWTMDNNVPQEEIVGFWQAGVSINAEGRIRITSVSASAPIVDDDPATIMVADAERIVPENVVSVMTDNAAFYANTDINNVYSCLNNNSVVMYRSFGFANDACRIYPCSANGQIAKGALPVDVSAEISTLLAPNGGSVGEYSYPVRYNDALILSAVCGGF